MYNLPYLKANAWVEVDSSIIVSNIKKIKRYIGTKKEIIGVVKGNAYGHGSKEISRLLVSNGIDKLAVATVEEGVELRKNGINVPILVLVGYVNNSQMINILNYNLTISVYNIEIIKKLSLLAKSENKMVKVHIWVDTGMNSLGVPLSEAINFIHYANKIPRIEIEGIFSHFASAEKNNKNEVLKEFTDFKDLLIKLSKMGIKPKIAHIANSAATIDLFETHLDAIRPGRIIYGIYPNFIKKDKMNLESALQVKCKVAQVKEVKSGTKIGYEGSYCTNSLSTTIVTLPLGSTDGISKSIEGKWEVIIKNLKRKIIAVCADVCMVDIKSLNPSIHMGEIVTILGSQNGLKIDLKELERSSHFTSGEILCRFSNRLPIFYKWNKNYYLFQKKVNQIEEIDG